MINKTISHYRILKRLETGGMGEIYKAMDLDLGRNVAIKFLSLDGLSEDGVNSELLIEARQAALVDHPQIATIHELGHSGGLFFIVMEYIEGESLARKIRQGPMDIAEALAIAVQIAEALNAVHGEKLLHCDISSANIMIGRGGRVKLFDFGLARRFSEIMSDASLTETENGSVFPSQSPGEMNAAAGTPAYMSPEQLRGDPLDERSDIYSLGIILYETITGRRPFEGDRPAVLSHAILHEEPSPLSAFRDDVPLRLEHIITKTLSKESESRYPDLSHFISDVSHLLNQLDLKEGLGEEERVTVSPSSKPDDQEDGGFRLPKKSSWFSKITARRIWFLWMGASLILVAGIDAFFFHPQGAGWFIVAALLVAGLAGVVVFAVLRRKKTLHVYQLPVGAAFRGLLPFQEADRDHFYGRKLETLALSDMIKSSDFRFGTLVGDSGSGKTSLIRAGLIPHLWHEGYVPLYCRSYKDPLATLLRECHKQSRIEILESESLHNYLQRVARELDAVLVIIFDQFEEFFVTFESGDDRDPFLSFVAEAYANESLTVKFLIGIRSDFLYLIGSEFSDRIEEPLISSRLFYLHNFSKSQAGEIIRRSAEHAQMPFETDFSRHLARDLASSPAGVVLPSELQIVGVQLQNKRIFDRREYRRVGGKEYLVHSYLEDVIRASGNPNGASMLLRSLISDENTRVTLPAREISRRTQQSGETVDRMLNLFIRARLIREIQEDAPWRYELMHEYLIDKINMITGKVMDARQRANRLFRQYLSNYHVDSRTRVPVGKLWFVRRYADVIQGEREKELLRKSLWASVRRISTIFVLLVVAATFAAAILSVREDWESRPLSDGHAAAVRQVVFSPAGRLLVSVGEDAVVSVWDFAQRKRIAQLNGHDRRVTTVSFSPDGSCFATGSADTKIIVWNSVDFKRVATLCGHRGPVRGVQFSPDGKWLATTGSQENVGQSFLWEAGSWKKLLELPVYLGDGNGHLFFFPGNHQITDGYGRVWEMPSGKQVGHLPEDMVSRNWAAVSPDDAQIAVIRSMGRFEVWNITHHEQLMTCRGIHKDHGRTVEYSLDGKWLASGAEDIVLWNAKTLEKLVRLQHSAIVWSLVFSPDSRWLVSSHGDGAILLWDVVERERVANFNQHCAPVRSVAFSPDGKQVASAGDDYSTIIWDLETGRKETALLATTPL